MKCSTCHGTGRIESVAFYYGVAECGSCEGSGIDPETPCPNECGQTYGQHWENDELPEDCVIEIPIGAKVRVVRGISETERDLATDPERVYTIDRYTKPNGYAVIKDEHGAWHVHPEALEPV